MKTSYSWTILSQFVAVKKADKSFIRYFETGIPIDIVPFFTLKELAPGESSEPFKVYISDRTISLFVKRKVNGRHTISLRHVGGELISMGISIGDEVWFEKSHLTGDSLFMYTNSKVKPILPNERAFKVSEKYSVSSYRLGQAYFRERVIGECNHKCVVTGVTDLRLLDAGHIKPWSIATDSERYDGSNGLLMAPHIHRLFDLGLITFENQNRLITSSKLEKKTLRDLKVKVGCTYQLTEAQSRYMEYHNKNIFLV